MKILISLLLLGACSSAVAQIRTKCSVMVLSDGKNVAQKSFDTGSDSYGSLEINGFKVEVSDLDTVPGGPQWTTVEISYGEFRTAKSEYSTERNHHSLQKGSTEVYAMCAPLN